jgi:hypothetical protein
MPNNGLIGSPPRPGIVQPSPGATTAATAPSLAPAPAPSPISAMPALGGLGSTAGGGFGSPTYDANSILPTIPDTGAAPGPAASTGSGVGAGY